MVKKGYYKQKSNRWLKYYAISICFGLMALFLNLFVFTSVVGIVQNIFDWSVGLGLVGGSLGLITNLIYNMIKKY